MISQIFEKMGLSSNPSSRKFSPKSQSQTHSLDNKSPINSVINESKICKDLFSVPAHPECSQDFRLTNTKNANAITTHPPDTNTIVTDEILMVKKHPDAIIPTRGTPFSVGLDLHCLESFTLQAGCQKLVDTGIALRCPTGTYGRIAPRSGITVKKLITVMAGVVDIDYLDSIKVVLFNYGKTSQCFDKKDKIAQLIFEQASLSNNIKLVEELPSTTRGLGGFGSTDFNLTNIISTSKERQDPKKINGQNIDQQIENNNEYELIKPLTCMFVTYDQMNKKKLMNFKWIKTNKNVIDCQDNTKYMSICFPKSRQQELIEILAS